MNKIYGIEEIIIIFQSEYVKLFDRNIKMLKEQSMILHFYYSGGGSL